MEIQTMTAVLHLPGRQNAGLNETCLHRQIIRTKPGPSGSAKGVASSRPAFFKGLSTLAIGFVCLAAPLRAQFAYVANFFGNNVSAYSIGANGALTPVPGSPFPAGEGTQSVAVDPTGKFAYVANSFEGNVSAYSIGANGALTLVPGSPFAAGSFPFSVAVDPTGKFAYVSNTSDNNVSAYSIGANGALTPVEGSPFAAGSTPQGVAVDPTGKFVYVVNTSIQPPDDNNVSAYSIGANGALIQVPGSPFAAGAQPRSVAVDPTGKFAYVANSNSVSAYSIGANGALTPVPGSPFAAGDNSTSVAVDPTGKFAYVASHQNNNVSAYSIGANGALTPVPGSPFLAGDGSISVAVDPTGKFAYVANLRDDNVSAYSIGANGALTPVPGSPFLAGDGSVFVRITPLVPLAITDFYLHGTGPNNNPPTLFVNPTPPTTTTEKFRDSMAVKFSGGNPWKEIGTWTSPPAQASVTMTELSDLHVWLGLKNSDDQGTRFDLRGELYKNSTLVTAGETYCIEGITRNPDLAKEVTLTFAPFSPAVVNTSEQLRLRILTRIGSNGAGASCGGHTNAVGLRLYFDASDRPASFGAQF